MAEEKTQKYKIARSDFRFRGKTYPEGSEIELTAAEYKAEKDKITLTPVKNVKEG